MRAAHAGQFQKNRHASVGIVCALDAPQAGQVRTLSGLAAAASRQE
jgi:hypothetical protein